MIRVVIIIGSILLVLWGINECSDSISRSNSEAEKAENAEWMSKIETAIGQGNFTEARTYVANISYYMQPDKVSEKINRAQIGFLINTGNIEQAYSIAQEENCSYVFTEMFMPKLSEIYQNSGKIKVVEYLSKVEFEYAPDFTKTYWYENDGNYKYNNAATKYNAQLEQFMTFIDVQGDKAFNTQLLKFVKPILEMVMKDRNYVTPILNNQTQKDIKKKLGL